MTTQAIDIEREGFKKPTTVAKTSAKTRMLYIDNLRILLTVLVILHHLAVGYGSFGIWYYNEPGQMSDIGSIGMLVFLAINQAFFMGFFFMISSYFIPGSLDRKGSGPYLIDRLIRLGIPLLFYILVIAPIINYIVRTNTWKFNLSTLRIFWANSINYIKSYPDIGIDVGPLWFVLTLLVFSFIYVLWHLTTKRWVSQPVKERPIPGNLAIAIFALIMGLISFIVRIRLSVGWEFKLLHLQLPHFPQYIAMFIVGIYAYRHNWLAGLADSKGKFWSWIAFVLIIFFPVFFLAADGLGRGFYSMLGGLHWQSLVFSIWEQLLCVAMVISLLVWFRNRYNYQGTLALAMSAASYAVYIFHALVIVLLAKSLRGIRIDLALKFLCVAPLAVALCYLVGYLVKKLPLARSIL